MKKLLPSIIFLFFTSSISAQFWVVFNATNSPLPNNNANEIKQDQTDNYWIATMGVRPNMIPMEIGQ